MRGHRGPDPLELLLLTAAVGLGAVFLLPVVAVAAPLGLGLLAVRKWWTAAVLAAAFGLPFVWLDPLAVAQAYAAAQQAAGTALLDALDTRTLPDPAPYLLAVAPFGLLLGLPCGAVAACVCFLLRCFRPRRVAPEATPEATRSPLVLEDAAALARAGGACQRCGAAPAARVHHTTYERLGAELPEDLLSLCAACHGIVHSRQGHGQEDAA